MGILASLTAKIGSIGDNQKGGASVSLGPVHTHARETESRARAACAGWIAYRASKAATNQAIVTLQRELSLRSTPSIAVALHPGTVVGTALSKPWTKEEDAGKKPGHFTAEVSSGKLLDVLKGLKQEDGGRFLNYDGKDLPW